MSKKALAVILGLSVTIGRGVAFYDLDFESVRRPLTPDPSDPFHRVPIANAMPTWHADIGGVAQTNVFYQDEPLSASHIALWSTESGQFTLQGAFTALLAPGSFSVSLSQHGALPNNVQSIQFLGLLGAFGSPPFDARFGFFVDEQRVPVFDLGPSRGYTLYGADLSPYAGKEVTLKFTAFADLPEGDNGGFFLDAISLSPQPVPEPGVLSLAGCFVLLGSLSWWIRRRSSRE